MCIGIKTHSYEKTVEPLTHGLNKVVHIRQKATFESVSSAAQPSITSAVN